MLACVVRIQYFCFGGSCFSWLICVPNFAFHSQEAKQTVRELFLLIVIFLSAGYKFAGLALS